MNKRYPVIQLVFLAINYPKMRVPELTAAFNLEFGTSKTEQQIKCTLGNWNIKCGRNCGFERGYSRIFTPGQLKFIKSGYRKWNPEELAIRLNKKFGTNFTAQQVRSRVHNQRIQSGRDCRFKKGHTPANKGIKGIFIPNSGQFRKGHFPNNVKPLGHERIDSDGYVWVKVAEPNPYTGAMTRYKQKSQIVWEAAHGKVTMGHNLVYLDGDKRNCSLQNLALVSDAELVRMNQMRVSDFPAELRPSILAVARLKTAAFKAARAKN